MASQDLLRHLNLCQLAVCLDTLVNTGNLGVDSMGAIVEILLAAAVRPNVAQDERIYASSLGSTACIGL